MELNSDSSSSSSREDSHKTFVEFAQKIVDVTDQRRKLALEVSILQKAIDQTGDYISSDTCGEEIWVATDILVKTATGLRKAAAGLREAAKVVREAKKLFSEEDKRRLEGTEIICEAMVRFPRAMFPTQQLKKELERLRLQQ